MWFEHVDGTQLQYSKRHGSGRSKMEKMIAEVFEACLVMIFISTRPYGRPQYEICN